MRTLLMVAWLVVVWSSMGYADRIYRSSDGNITGTRERSGSTQIYRSRDGNIIGTSDRTGVSRGNRNRGDRENSGSRGRGRNR